MRERRGRHGGAGVGLASTVMRGALGWRAACSHTLARLASSRRTSVWIVTLATLLFWASFLLIVARARYGGDLRTFLCLGNAGYHPPELAAVPRAGESGYDGQFYVALATDPWLRRPDTPRALDAPSYRATRIGIPLLAWFLALGQPSAAVYAYQLLAWLLGIAAVHLIARWLTAEHHSPWGAILLATAAGLSAAIIRCTPDGAALLLALAALWAQRNDRPKTALALATGAVLSRETAYLAVLGMAFEALRRRRFSSMIMFGVIPMAVLAGWQLYLRRVLGTAFDNPLGNFAVPFAWLPQRFAIVFDGAHVRSWTELWGLLAVVATTAALIVLASRPRTWMAVEAAFLLFAGMGVFLASNVYCEAWAYARALIALPFLAAVIAFRQEVRWRRWLFLSITVFYALTGWCMAHDEWAMSLAHRSVGSVLRNPPALGQGFAIPVAAPVATPTATVVLPAGGAVLYAVPVANLEGRAGAQWQTALVITNLSGNANPVTVELLLDHDRAVAPTSGRVQLRPHGSISFGNALDELFHVTGAGALQIAPKRGAIAVSSRTYNAALHAAPGTLLAAVGVERALAGGSQGLLPGLYHDRAFDAGVRSNVGLLNVGPVPTSVRLRLYDGRGSLLGQLTPSVAPGEFKQVNNVFGPFAPRSVADGRVVVEPVTPGASVLCYASVIRGPQAEEVYVWPTQQSPDGSATRHRTPVPP